jgi:hypothetical protein
MNNCSYHPNNFAVVQCNSCGRTLCSACDHRIKGFPYCQDCIVSGIDLLRQQRDVNASSLTFGRRGSPIAAVLLSFVCPGLGAAYNGQNSKALAHFGVFVGLFQMAVLTKAALFVFGFIGMWFFAAVDAYRTARAIKYGATPKNDDFLTRQLSGNPLVWAMSLIILGVLFFLVTTLNIRLPIERLLPVLLVGLGVYWLVHYIQRKRNQETTVAPFPASLPPADEATYTSVNVARFRSNKY